MAQGTANYYAYRIDFSEMKVLISFSNSILARLEQPFRKALNKLFQGKRLPFGAFIANWN